MADNMLQLIENNERLIVVKHLCKSPLDVAKNPEFAMDHAYYSITKGESHVFTVVKQDGTKWSFTFGGEATTMVDASTIMLKDRVLAFLNDVNVPIISKINSICIDRINGRVRLILRKNTGYETQSMQFDTTEEAKKKAEKFAGKPLTWTEWHNGNLSGLLANL